MYLIYGMKVQGSYTSDTALEAHEFKCRFGSGIDSLSACAMRPSSLIESMAVRAGICSRVKGWKIDSWNRLGIEGPMSHVHVKINFSYGIDSWNRCLSVHKRLQIRALFHEAHIRFRNRFQSRLLRISSVRSRNQFFSCLFSFCLIIQLRRGKVSGSTGLSPHRNQSPGLFRTGDW